MDRQLIDYLPPVLAETREMGAIMTAEQPEIESAWDTWRQVLGNAFVQTADARGLARWENIIGILPKGRDSLEQRRRQIMLRLNEKLPFTYKALSDMLTAVFGADGFVLEVDPLTYRLLVTLPVDIDSGVNLRGLPGLLARVVPVNMIYRMRAEMKEHLDARAHFLLRRFGIHAAVNLFGVQTIYFDGARTFDGSWPFSPVFTRGASFKTFIMCTSQDVRQRAKPGILLGGFAAVNEALALRRLSVWTHHSLFGLPAAGKSGLAKQGGGKRDSSKMGSGNAARGAHLHLFAMRYTLHQSAPDKRVRVRLDTAADASSAPRLAHVGVQANVQCGKKLCVPALRFQHQKNACPETAASVTKDTMWRLDGGYLLNGARRLNAAVIKTTL